MHHDPLSPIAPARIRVLLVPVGKVRKSVFLSIVKGLNSLPPLPLSQLYSEERVKDIVLSPLTFKHGFMFYDFQTEAPSEAQQSLAPFELFRDHVIVLGITETALTEPEPYQKFIEELQGAYGKTLIHRVVAFDQRAEDVQDVLILPPNPTTDAFAKLLNQLSVILLEEWSSYVTSVQTLQTIQSPLVPVRQPDSPVWQQQESRPPSILSDHQPLSPRPTNKELNRMSMPIPSTTPLSPTSSDVLSVGSPGFSKPPARTFEEMSMSNSMTSPTPLDRFKNRPASMLSREESRDRIPAVGFGNDSFSERARDKGKGRVGVVVASIFLHAGLWPVALSTAVDSAQKARWYSDHIWHGRALEIISICMMFLTWSDLQFQMPQVFQTHSDINSLTKHESTQQYEPEIKHFADDDMKAKFMRSLSFTLPTSINMILTIYDRSSISTTGDPIPQLAQSECHIRVAKFLSAMQLCGGYLSDKCLSHIVLGEKLEISSLLSQKGVKLHPTKREITNILAAANPLTRNLEELSTIDVIHVLSGIAGVYRSIGMERKKALALKELIAFITPALSKAQILGAAEAGLHPSAKLAALSKAFDDSNEYVGIEAFLADFCQSYGISAIPTVSSPDWKVYPSSQYGDLDIKVDILNMCIQLCETLSDHRGVLYYCTALLRTMGPNVAANAEALDPRASLSTDEQTHIFTKINKTVAQLKSSGHHDIQAQYWDDFLVRGLYLMEASTSGTLRPHKKADLKVDDKKQKDPFLHNPFLEQATTQQWNNLLSAKSEREFVVVLHNPFEFVVEIEYAKLIADDRELGITKTEFLLKPYRTQNVSIMGSIDKVGEVEITGCLVKIQGCKEQFFPIFKETWKPTAAIKIKQTGGEYRKSAMSRQSDTSLESSDLDASTLPKSTSLLLNVIPPQPLLTVTNTSIPENALMLLEGETVPISVTLTNTSDIAVDFVHVSFFDSVSSEFQTALSQKGMLPADMYEMEYQMIKMPTISTIGSHPTSIDAGCSVTYEFEMLAKYGLSSAAFHFDYANLETPHSKTADTFFTRQVVYNLAVTVNPSLQVQRMEILPTPESYNAETADNVEHCLVMLDLRNSWLAPLKCELQSAGSETSMARSSQIIKPGQVYRHVLSVPKIYLANPFKRITPLSPTRKRQFVVSAEKISPDIERAVRESFWFRQALLDAIIGSWQVMDDTRERGGTIIDLRNIRIHPQMLEALRLPDLSLGFELSRKGLPAKKAHAFEVTTDEFLSLNINLLNRSPRNVYPFIRIRPHLADQPREISLDLNKRLAWSGVLQQTIERIEPNQESNLMFSFCVLAAGKYEISISVEETRASEASETNEDKDDDLLDDLAKTIDRRCWVVGQSCTVLAQDA